MAAEPVCRDVEAARNSARSLIRFLKDFGCFTDISASMRSSQHIIVRARMLRYVFPTYTAPVTMTSYSIDSYFEKINIVDVIRSEPNQLHFSIELPRRQISIKPYGAWSKFIAKSILSDDLEPGQPSQYDFNVPSPPPPYDEQRRFAMLAQAANAQTGLLRANAGMMQANIGLARQDPGQLFARTATERMQDLSARTYTEGELYRMQQDMNQARAYTQDVYLHRAPQDLVCVENNGRMQLVDPANQNVTIKPQRFPAALLQTIRDALA